MSFPKFELWSIPLWGGNVKEVQETKDSNATVCCDYGGSLGVRDVRFTLPLKETTTRSSSSSSSYPRNKKKKNNNNKWDSRQERMSDVEDIVLVSNDNDGVASASDSDWSIGWLEPHGSDFLTDDETDDSFAVLVPCYRNHKHLASLDPPHPHLLNTLNNLTTHPFTEEKNMMDQWLSSLQNF